MNVGIFADCYAPTLSGVVTAIVQLRDGLEQRGHRAVVVTVHTPGGGEEEPAVYRFPSVPFNSDSNFRLGLVSQRTVRRIVREEQLDVVHTHTEFSVGWAAKRAARTLGVPLVHTAHTLYEEYRHYLVGGSLLPAGTIRAFLRRFLAGYDALVCPSTKARDYVRSFAPHIRTVVIENGISPARLGPSLTGVERSQVRKALGIRPTDKVILYAGRIGREKRVLELLDALTPLLRNHPHFRALLVGCGPSFKRVRKAVRERTLGGQVILTGTVAWAEMHKLYSVADVFVTASLSEVHPMSLIEASMCGLPIVARRDDGYAGLVQDGRNGYLVDSDRDIAARVLEILSDEATRRRFSREGLALSTRFTAEAHATRLESLYQQVLREQSARAGAPRNL